MKPILKNIDHIHVFVPDRQEALKWYGTVLGFEPVKNYCFGQKLALLLLEMMRVIFISLFLKVNQITIGLLSLLIQLEKNLLFGIKE